MPSGQWVQLLSTHLDAPQEILLRTAAEVTVADRLIPVPLQISAVPAGFELLIVNLYRPGTPDSPTGKWKFELLYSVNGNTAASITATAAGTDPDRSGTCETKNGLDVCVMGGPQWLMDEITSFGTNEDNWTTRMYG